MWWLAVALAAPLDLSLDEGEVVQVRTTPDGQLAGVRALGRIDAPIDEVWKVLVDFDHHQDWLAMVSHTKVAEVKGNVHTVDWVVQVPGPNLKFSCDWVVDAEHHTMSATGARGALEGGAWSWALHDGGDHTLVERTTDASAVVDSWLIRQFDDDARTLQLGINLTSPLVEVQGLKRAVEGRASK